MKPFSINYLFGRFVEKMKYVIICYNQHKLVTCEPTSNRNNLVQNFTFLVETTFTKTEK